MSFILGRYGTATPGYNLLDLNPVAWWDASDAATITIDSGVVSAWADKSGNGFNVSQSDSAKRPTYDLTAINGLNAVLWPSINNNDFLRTTTTGPVLDVRQFYAVIKFANPTFSNYEGLFNVANGGVDGWFVGNSPGSNLFFVNGGTYINGDNGTDRQSSGLAPELSNGCLVRVVLSATQSTTDFVIGMDRLFDNLDRGWKGYICEIATFDTLLTGGERTDLETHLMDKWGV